MRGRQKRSVKQHNRPWPKARKIPIINKAMIDADEKIPDGTLYDETTIQR